MEPLKNIYNPVFLGKVADIGAATIKGFDKKVFLDQVFSGDWIDLELKQRIRRISTVLHQMLSGDFSKDIKQVLRFADGLHKLSGRDDSYLYMFVPDYIEQFGIDHVDAALRAMEKVTVLSSCEYAIRPFIVIDKVRILGRMLQWATHSHPSVRRLASEGCRPRLPWGMALQDLKKDPALILPILEVLKSDQSEFVRRSVANNINDIAKDNPQVVMTLVEGWKGKDPNTDWIVKHGCRTLLKKADQSALSLFGLSLDPGCSVEGLKTTQKSIRIGDHLHFSFRLQVVAKEAVLLRIEYVITYVKANNKESKKVFKITENTYRPGQVVDFSRRQSFADMTTRKHYSGAHTIAITVNGKQFAACAFDLVE